MGYDWENPECLQFTLTYAPDHDGTCTGENLCDDGSDECESDQDCEDGQICDDGECIYYEDGGDECESDEDCEVSYRDKSGKYQSQVGITLPKL